LLNNFTGDNTDFSINFVPKMKYETLVNGYKHVLDTIYSPRHYYERAVTFLKEYWPRMMAGISKLRLSHVTGFFRALWVLGFVDRGRRYFWRLVFTTFLKHPHKLPISMGLSLSGFHFRKVTEGYSKIFLRLKSQSVT
jgi:hypothetical protein